MHLEDYGLWFLVEDYDDISYSVAYVKHKKELVDIINSTPSLSIFIVENGNVIEDSYIYLGRHTAAINHLYNNFDFTKESLSRRIDSVYKDMFAEKALEAFNRIP